MKKLLLILGLAVVLTGCGGDESTDQSVATPPASESTVAAESASVEETADTSKIVVGEPIVFDGFTMTIKSFDVVKDYEDVPFLRVVYDWENTSEESTAPFMTFSLTGFQDGVETDSKVFISDDLDLATGQKQVKPGGKITDAQDAVALDDPSKPIELELKPMFSFDDKATKTITIDPQQ